MGEEGVFLLAPSFGKFWRGRAIIARFTAEYDRLRNRIHAIHIDKLDNRTDAHFFAKWSRDWREQQVTCQREIEWRQAADQNYLEEGARILELAQGAADLFKK